MPAMRRRVTPMFRGQYSMRIMKRRTMLAQGAGLLLGGRVWAQGVQPPSPLARAQAAMGAPLPQALQWQGQGTRWLPGLGPSAASAWPAVKLNALAVAVDFASAAWREESLLDQPGPHPGPRHAVALLAGDVAWNRVGPLALGQPWTVAERLLGLWANPHGALWALQQWAAAGAGLQFALADHWQVRVVLDSAQRVQRVEAQGRHPLWGAVQWQSRFDDYADWAGVRFPRRVRESLNGSQTLDLRVESVQATPPWTPSVPASARSTGASVQPEALARGVWLLAGVAHHSVAIEMSDHVLLVDAPLGPERSAAVLQALERRIPGKPLGMVLVTHHHADTLAGVPALLAQGAGIIAPDSLRGVADRLLALVPRAALAAGAAGRTARFVGVRGKSVLSDGERQIELYVLEGNPHAREMLLVYLPAERLLIQADAYTPGPAFAPPERPPRESLRHLWAALARWGLDVERVVSLRGRVVAWAEMRAAAEAAA